MKKPQGAKEPTKRAPPREPDPSVNSPVPKRDQRDGARTRDDASDVEREAPRPGGRGDAAC